MRASRTKLFHAVLGDVTMTAKDLLRQHGISEANFGERAFDHRRKQTHVVVGGFTLSRVGGAPCNVAAQRGPQHQCTGRFIERAHGHQHAADIGMHDNRIGGLVRKFRAA